MGLEQLTVLIITFNEEANICRTLDGLAWASKILVVDSFSTDGTMNILKGDERVRVIQREFASFADQCNFGLSEIGTLWVLSIDADYVFPDFSAEAIQAAMESNKAGYRAEFEYCVDGKPVRGSILPPRTVLYQKDRAVYVDDGHGHRVVVDGEVGTLPFRIRHDDRKPLSRWLQSQITYARQEAEMLLNTTNNELSRNDRIRKLVVLAPALVFLLVYIVRGGVLGGWRGLFYALQRFVAETLLSLFLIDAKLKNKLTGDNN